MLCRQAWHANQALPLHNKFCAACEVQQHKLTFYGVNAHFQNGIAEQAIHNLSEGASKQLLHACQR
jgi:hypothetical protein